MVDTTQTKAYFGIPAKEYFRRAILSFILFVARIVLIIGSTASMVDIRGEQNCFVSVYITNVFLVLISLLNCCIPVFFTNWQPVLLMIIMRLKDHLAANIICSRVVKEVFYLITFLDVLFIVLTAYSMSIYRYLSTIRIIRVVYRAPNEPSAPCDI